jgi:hypothetical protein
MTYAWISFKKIWHFYAEEWNYVMKVKNAQRWHVAC